MEIQGKIENGRVVIDGDVMLPEGAIVWIVCADTNATRAPGKTKRVEVPLVRCQKPGSVHLTNLQIAEVLDAEDIST